MNTCKTCQIEKSLDQFYFRKDSNTYRSWCKICEQVRVSTYVKKNINEHKKRCKEYYKKEKEVIKAKVAKWRENNYEYAIKMSRVRGKKWRLDNPGKHCARQSKRRAWKLKATPTWADLEKIKLVYEKAQEFSKLMGKQFHVDHVYPLKGKNVCGLHVWENLQLLEAELNLKKSNRS